MQNHIIQAVVFDAFGTLVKIGEGRRPYRQLMQLAKASGRTPQTDDARHIMTKTLGFSGLADWLGVDLSSIQPVFEHDMATELASIVLYPDSLTTPETLKQRGLKLAICSNLAAPYGPPVKKLLPNLDAYFFSYEMEALKPDPEIYAQICDELKLLPDQILFVGDTYEADVTGPRKAGMQALHLARSGNSPEGQAALRSLDELV
jgi:HAD superfamily hydrolase (TIGR01509 family)